MRLISLDIHGFRGFTQNVHFDLAADAVIIVGANGQGKTSFFDSILWVLTGTVPRLDANDADLISLFSDTGEMRVALQLQNQQTGFKYEVIRSSDGSRQNLTFKIRSAAEEQSYSHDAARLKLIESLWPGAVAGNDLEKSLASAYVRSIYLQQDLVRQFIDADDEQERFNVVSELVGAGRVTELQLQLERSKVAWVKSCNTKKQALDLQNQRLAVLEAQMHKLDNSPQDSLIKESWSSWWAAYNNVLQSSSPLPSPESREAATVLDTAIRRTQGLVQANERNKQLASSLVKDVVARRNAPKRSGVQEVEEEISSLRSAAETLRKQMLELQTKSAELRRERLQLRETQAELRAFAQMALKHLGNRCPVCEQTYDVAATRKRLTDIVNQGASTDLRDDANLESDVATVAAAFAEVDKKIVDAQSRLQEARRNDNEFQAWLTNRDIVLQQLGIKSGNDVETEQRLQQFVLQVDAQNKTLLQLMQSGEKLALSLAQATEQARKQELRRDIDALSASNNESSKTIAGLEATERLASDILEGLREASTEVVNNQLKRIEPLFQRIYARVDVHPAFRTVSFRTEFSNRRGRLFTAMLDRIDEVSTEAPEVVLSSSQMNALAVAIFLSLNLGLPGLPLESVLLDDPLQSLDDVNLLGLIDLLRRTKDQRQLLVSTHDVRFGKLLERKLRAVENTQRTTIIEFLAWQRSGPVVSQRDAFRDERPMRIAVA
jgi:DNA repair exonuclease SbcCD ATPase subunit